MSMNGEVLKARSRTEKKNLNREDANVRSKAETKIEKRSKDRSYWID